MLAVDLGGPVEVERFQFDASRHVTVLKLKDFAVRQTS